MRAVAFDEDLEVGFIEGVFFVALRAPLFVAVFFAVVFLRAAVFLAVFFAEVVFLATAFLRAVFLDVSWRAEERAAVFLAALLVRPVALFALVFLLALLEDEVVFFLPDVFFEGVMAAGR